MTAAEQNHRLTEVKSGHICLGLGGGGGCCVGVDSPYDLMLLCKLQATEQLWARLQLVNITK